MCRYRALRSIGGVYYRVYEPKPDPVPPTPEKPDPSLPNDFNQSTATIRQMTLTVEVNDEFNASMITKYGYMT